MLNKPPLSQLKKRSALWFDGYDLRITLSTKEHRATTACPARPKCKSCMEMNSWHYVVDMNEWKTSFFSIGAVRENYEFVGFI